MKKLLALFLLLPAIGISQILTPENAVSIALQSNFDIYVARNSALGDSIMNTPGEAGMLPTVMFNSGFGVNQNNINQRFSNGNEITSNNAGGTSLTAGIALSWTLFDGTKMFVTKRKLDQIEMQGDYRFRNQVLNTTSDVLIAYYDMVRRKEQINATREIIAYNVERVKITDSRFKSGIGPKTDLLQAQIDLNIQKENQLELEYEMANAKREFNALLARDVLTEFDVIDSIPLTAILNRAELEQKMIRSNPGLLALNSQVSIATLTLRETRTQYLPRIAGTAGYNFSRANNTAGFSLYNQAYGWNAGLTLSMPLYMGGSLRRQGQIRMIEIDNANLQLQQATLNAKVALRNALNLYDARNAALVLEKENETLARENMQLSIERLRLGQGTALEVAQAQATLASALFRLAGFQFDVKKAEINVRRQSVEV